MITLLQKKLKIDQGQRTKDGFLANFSSSVFRPPSN